MKDQQRDQAKFAWRRDGPALLGLMALACVYLWMTWRKWPEALIDFGRELYTPWRLSEGAVLYRDVDSYYGPLSPYLNAQLFSLFGPGMMVLAAANLVVFAAITVLLHGLCRRSWGSAAAIGACSVFVAVFGFSQLGKMGSFNFVAPYSHQATHGFLVCIGLVVLLERWMQAPGVALSLAAGVFLGLTAVLKPEFMVAGAAVTAAAVALSWRHSGRPKATCAVAWLGGAILPTALFAVLFARHVPWSEAFDYAGRAWINVTGGNSAAFAGDAIQANYLGLDHPVENLVRQTRATLIALGVFAGLGGVAWSLGRLRNPVLRYLAATLCGGAILWGSSHWIVWVESGRALPGLMILAMTAAWMSAWRKGDGQGSDETRRLVLQCLVVALAGALLLRMGLFGRLYHYGFYQAALAGVVIAAISLRELPRRISPDPWTRWAAFAGIALLLGSGAGALTAQTAQLLSYKTQSIGEGRDQFFGYSREAWPTDSLVALISEGMRREPASATLVVLPEGVMINYLGRKRSTVAPFIFFSSTTFGDREAGVVKSLSERPPDWILIITRDLREYGIERYGEKPGSGKLIMDWVNENYELSAKAGADPLDPTQFGAQLLERKP